MTKTWSTTTDIGPYELNTVIHGDCREVLPGFPNACVDLVVTSPPFNVGMDYGPGISDWRPWGEYYAWLEEVLRQLYRVLKPGGVLALDLPKEVRLKSAEIEAVGRRVEKVSTVVDNLCLDLGYLPRESVVWAKGSEGLPITPTAKSGSDNNIYLRHACHVILLFSKDRYYYDGGTGRRGKLDVPWGEETKDTWWWIPPARSNGHPCPFPEEVPRRLIDLFTCPRPERGFVPLVLDLFAGRGTTGIVARRMGRNFVGIELNAEWAAEATAQVAATRSVISSPVTAEITKDGMVLRLPLSAIVADSRVNVRDGLDEATVAHYTDIFDRLPPVVVFSTPEGYLLASGFHRLEAARRLGRAEIAAEVREGTRAEAEEFAILDNVAHGRPYTRAERRRAVERMLKLHPQRSDNWIAQDLGVSDHTVRVVREELEATSQIAKLDRLVGRDGKERPRSVSPLPPPTGSPGEDVPVGQPVSIDGTEHVYEAEEASALLRSGGSPGHDANPSLGSQVGALPSADTLPDGDASRRRAVCTVHCAEVLEWAGNYSGERFHALLADVPYGLEFMGREWDAPHKGVGFSVLGRAYTQYGVASKNMALPQHGSRNRTCQVCHGAERGRDGRKVCQCPEPRWNHPATSIEAGLLYQSWVTEWARALIENVLHPGAVCAFFGGTRTFHRLAAGLEDAGFEIFDVVLWLYGQGMAKGQNVSKAMDGRAFRDWLDSVDHGLSPAEVRLAVSAAVQGGISYEERHGRSFAGARDSNTVQVRNLGPSAMSRGRELLARIIAEHWDGPGGTLPPGVRVRVGARIERSGWKAINAANARAGYRPRDYYEDKGDVLPVTAPTRGPALSWDGYNTALKPAWEPVILCRAPRRGKTFVELAQEYGTGALNVDGCRIAIPGGDEGGVWGSSNATCRSGFNDSPAHAGYRSSQHPRGRWPANLALGHTERCRRVGTRRVRGIRGTAAGRMAGKSTHIYGEFQGSERAGEPTGYADADGYETVEVWECAPDCPVRQLDEQTGELRSGDDNVCRSPRNKGWSNFEDHLVGQRRVAYGDNGGASRFFYVAKVAPWEAHAGVRDFYWRRDAASPTGFARVDGDTWRVLPKRGRGRGNIHPTKKPIELVTWLARLLCMPPRPGGEPRRLLVPFCGTGAEVIGGAFAGFDAVEGIEMLEDYAGLARARARWWTQFGGYDQARQAWKRGER
jgi:DNA modification methylase